MKVFKMNDVDHVCAKDEESAKKFYEEFIDREEIDEFFEGEVPLSNTMLYRVDDLKREEIKDSEERVNWYGEDWIKRTFAWVIKRDNITEPCVICSTEQ